jgi:hypothetical protein
MNGVEIEEAISAQFAQNSLIGALQQAMSGGKDISCPYFGVAPVKSCN